ncbi:unnamed protein product [Clonostachys solani]|uniref:Protein kinase domain-containing protein n=1 Tax=Clonostachys solani TaxID=160281 RepID=A0A9P0EIN5_9HYPO|nr:unnamed protein product [Clonostachys solani]
MGTLFRAFRAGFNLAGVTTGPPDKPPDWASFQKTCSFTFKSEAYLDEVCFSFHDRLKEWPQKPAHITFKYLQAVDFCFHLGAPRMVDWGLENIALIEDLGVIKPGVGKTGDAYELARLHSYGQELAGLLRDQQRLERERGGIDWKARMKRVVTADWATEASSPTVAATTTPTTVIPAVFVEEPTTRSLPQKPPPAPSETTRTLSDPAQLGRRKLPPPWTPKSTSTTDSGVSFGTIGPQLSPKPSKAELGRKQSRNSLLDKPGDSRSGAVENGNPSPRLSPKPSQPRLHKERSRNSLIDKPSDSQARNINGSNQNVKAVTPDDMAKQFKVRKDTFELRLKAQADRQPRNPVANPALSSESRRLSPSPRRHHLPDLVRDSRLDTTFDLNSRTVCHVSFITNLASRQRRVKTEVTWKRSKRIGAGGFGSIWLERCVEGGSLGQLRAVKEIAKQPDATHAVDYTRELEAIAKFSHERYSAFFVQSTGWYEDEYSIFIPMDYHEMGDLQQFMKRPLPEREAKDIISQILEGLALMHDNGFTHRDLKPANILVVETSPQWWVKITDFGISKRAEESSPLCTVIGTPAYLAPEVRSMQHRPRHLGLGGNSTAGQRDSYTNAVDLWSTGVIAYQLLTTQLVFSEPGSLQNYAGGKAKFPRQPLTRVSASDICLELLAKLLSPAAAERPSAAEALAHSWMLSPDMTGSQTGKPGRFSDTYRSHQVYSVTEEASAEWPSTLG